MNVERLERRLEGIGSHSLEVGLWFGAAVLRARGSFAGFLPSWNTHGMSVACYSGLGVPREGKARSLNGQCRVHVDTQSSNRLFALRKNSPRRGIRIGIPACYIASLI